MADKDTGEKFLDNNPEFAKGYYEKKVKADDASYKDLSTIQEAEVIFELNKEIQSSSPMEKNTAHNSPEDCYAVSGPSLQLLWLQGSQWDPRTVHHSLRRDTQVALSEKYRDPQRGDRFPNWHGNCWVNGALPRSLRISPTFRKGIKKKLLNLENKLIQSGWFLIWKTGSV